MSENTEEYTRRCIELLKRTAAYLESIEYIIGRGFLQEIANSTGGTPIQELKRDINKQLGVDEE